MRILSFLFILLSQTSFVVGQFRTAADIERLLHSKDEQNDRIQSIQAKLNYRFPIRLEYYNISDADIIGRLNYNTSDDALLCEGFRLDNHIQLECLNIDNQFVLNVSFLESDSSNLIELETSDGSLYYRAFADHEIENFSEETCTYRMKDKSFFAFLKAKSTIQMNKKYEGISLIAQNGDYHYFKHHPSNTWSNISKDAWLSFLDDDLRWFADDQMRLFKKESCTNFDNKISLTYEWMKSARALEAEDENFNKSLGKILSTLKNTANQKINSNPDMWQYIVQVDTEVFYMNKNLLAFQLSYLNSAQQLDTLLYLNYDRRKRRFIPRESILNTLNEVIALRSLQEGMNLKKEELDFLLCETGIMIFYSQQRGFKREFVLLPFDKVNEIELKDILKRN